MRRFLAGLALTLATGLASPAAASTNFDRLKIQVCRPRSLEPCSEPVMLHRDGVGEFGHWRP
ncbi:hypothetical protein ACIOD2_14450 [Amycolatopsis sp. NPDC088138]|uniref:hypothetical protein n=1 Tax=Amycolatopsis sp. NPDC088138 TaxID=3363938 RepID=UPI00382EE296